MLQKLQPAGRSGTAATDAIGAYRFIDTLYELQVRRRERHAAPLQRAMKALRQTKTSG